MHESKRETCESCPYSEMKLLECRRHSPAAGYGWPRISLLSWCGDHPVLVAMDESIKATPLAHVMEKARENNEEMLTRLGK